MEPVEEMYASMNEQQRSKVEMDNALLEAAALCGKMATSFKESHQQDAEARAKDDSLLTNFEADMNRLDELFDRIIGIVVVADPTVDEGEV